MRYFKFIAPLLIVVLIDLLFQIGAWNPLASPMSHAGKSIMKKRALEDVQYEHIDFVTLGSSRPVYGIDHAAVSRAAADAGFVHANVSVAGMHWMSLEVITHWLSDHHPEIRGGVIALAIQDFLSPGNGSYEIGIAYPFRRFSDIGPMREHVSFDWHDPSTYALYSGLFEYHEDVQDFLKSPQHRRHNLEYFRSLSPKQVLAENVEETKNICDAHIQTLADCDSLASRPHDAAFDAQCALVKASAQGRGDLRPVLAPGAVVPEELARARDIIRRDLRNLPWSQPAIVVLMPMESLWMSDVMPLGTHEWALSVLQPLVEEGRIRLIDETDYFTDANCKTDCTAFFDLYHNNVSGRDRLMQSLTPYFRDHLFIR